MDVRLRVIVLVLLSAVAGTDRANAARFAFTTSTKGNANLSTWPEAMQANASGLAAADAICQGRATAAGLSEPDTYVAWLSDRDNDAVCRLLGHDGKLADNCGVVDLPPQIGPWTRTDGTPFAESLVDLLAGDVLSPLMLDESGARIGSPYESFSATRPDGAFNDISDDAPDCERWTSAALDNDYFAATGNATGTTASWTDAQGGVSCDATRRLICMQRGADAALPPRPIDGRLLAFVTQADQDGDLGGVTGADAICKAAATQAQLSAAPSFKALLTAGFDTPTVADRFYSHGPWYRLDGMLFAKSMDEITSGEVTAPLNLTEAGVYLGYAHAFTGAEKNGTPSTLDCAGWTATSGIGSASIVNEVFYGPHGTGRWLGTSEVTCGTNSESARKIYCLADIEPLFGDGFEL